MSLPHRKIVLQDLADAASVGIDIVPAISQLTVRGMRPPRITFDPKLMGGRACIRGMRITVSLVVNLVANGMSTDEIIREYPDLEAEDVSHALRWASSLTTEEIHPFTASAA